MHNLLHKTSLAGLLLAGLSMLSTAGPAAAQDDRLIRRCSAEGPRDISMTARYEERRGRKKFTVEMEAAPNAGFQAGQAIVFFVAGRAVGADRLQRVIGGDLVGELNLDTQAGPGDDENPFPPNFPPVRNGTRVLIKSGGENVLGCALR
jgi:hypothetical protein